MVVTVEKLDDPGQSLVLPATSGEEDLLLTSPVHSKSSGLSPCLEIADNVLFNGSGRRQFPDPPNKTMAQPMQVYKKAQALTDQVDKSAVQTEVWQASRYSNDELIIPECIICAFRYKPQIVLGCAQDNNNKNIM